MFIEDEAEHSGSDGESVDTQSSVGSFLAPSDSEDLSPPPSPEFNLPPPRSPEFNLSQPRRKRRRLVDLRSVETLLLCALDEVMWTILSSLEVVERVRFLLCTNYEIRRRFHAYVKDAGVGLLGQWGCFQETLCAVFELTLGRILLRCTPNDLTLNGLWRVESIGRLGAISLPGSVVCNEWVKTIAAVTVAAWDANRCMAESIIALLGAIALHYGTATDRVLVGGVEWACTTLAKLYLRMSHRHRSSGARVAVRKVAYMWEFGDSMHDCGITRENIEALVYTLERCNGASLESRLCVLALTSLVNERTSLQLQNHVCAQVPAIAGRVQSCMHPWTYDPSVDVLKFAIDAPSNIQGFAVSELLCTAPDDAAVLLLHMDLSEHAVEAVETLVCTKNQLARRLAFTNKYGRLIMDALSRVDARLRFIGVIEFLGEDALRWTTQFRPWKHVAQLAADGVVPDPFFRATSTTPDGLPCIVKSILHHRACDDAKLALGRVYSRDCVSKRAVTRVLNGDMGSYARNVAFAYGEPCHTGEARTAIG